MKKILLVFGTRPEAIKMAPVYAELKKLSGLFQTAVCVTAQHRQMLDQVLDFFSIVPDYDLNLMKAGQSLNDVQASVLIALKPVLEEFRPDLVLVHGDTTTTMAASLAAFYEQIPVGHIEAGLRSHDKYAPYPEEINRQVTTRIAEYHFAPTFRAKQNLLDERIAEEQVLVTGNTVVDALFAGLEILKTSESAAIEKLTRLLDTSKRMVLITAHRRENFGDAFENMCQAMLEISYREDVQLVFPVHLNPNVRNTVFRMLEKRPNILLLEPQPYEAFLFLMKRAAIILTDSGGIQEEAPSLGIPVLVMRDNTERPEGVESGVVKLVGTKREVIVKEAMALLDDADYYTSISQKANPFGDGTAAFKIAEFLSYKLTDKA